jgi:hypothetical protein
MYVFKSGQNSKDDESFSKRGVVKYGRVFPGKQTNQLCTEEKRNISQRLYTGKISSEDFTFGKDS